MAADKLWQRQIEQPAFVLINETAVLFARGEILAADNHGSAKPARLGFENGERVVVLLGKNGGDSALENAGFFDGDLLDRVAEKLGMVDRNRRDDRQCRLRDDIRRIDAAA